MNIGFGILALLGIAIWLASLFYLKENAPGPSLNPRKWVAIWKQKQFFQGPGYTLMLIGMVFWGIGMPGWIITSFLH